MVNHIAIVAALGFLLTGCGATAVASAAVEDQSAFLDRCNAEGADDCDARWHWAGNAAPLADALLALASEGNGSLPAEMHARLTAVQWSSATNGTLGDLAVTLSGKDRISIHWQEQGAEPHYDLIQALRMRGVTLESLGCPRYPMASMGQEKVMIAKPEGSTPFILTVYGRFAPTSVEYAIYAVDADFGGAMPDSAALAAGRYPGGGGRAFAVDATGWMETCPDPVS